MTALRLATRRSALALAQAETVAAAIRDRSGVEVELVPVVSEGDRSTAPLREIGGVGVFVTAVREALLSGAADVAVHSLKDLPTAADDSLRLAAVPPRADVRDAVVARTGTLGDLPPGATVGTGSARRAAQLRQLRPDLVVNFGGQVTSKNIKTLLRAQPPRALWHVRPSLTAPDTYQALTHVVPMQPGVFFAELVARLADDRSGAGDTGYAAAWRALDAQAAAEIDRLFSGIFWNASRKRSSNPRYLSIDTPPTVTPSGSPARTPAPASPAPSRRSPPPAGRSARRTRSRRPLAWRSGCTRPPPAAPPIRG